MHASSDSVRFITAVDVLRLYTFLRHLLAHPRIHPPSARLRKENYQSQREYQFNAALN